jgi:hypothetical protein
MLPGIAYQSLEVVVEERTNIPNLIPPTVGDAHDRIMDLLEHHGATPPDDERRELSRALTRILSKLYVEALTAGALLHE